MISRSDELRLIYDDHAKAAKDQFSALKDARAEGEARGKAEGRAEGERIGRIRTLQQILGNAATDTTELAALSVEDLDSLAGELQKRLQDRM